jgi:predicted dehydrogenase
VPESGPIIAPHMSAPKIAVLGAGLIGRRHAGHIARSPDATLGAIVDPSPAAQDLARQLATEWFPDFPAMIARMRPDGLIVATPNSLHVEHGIAAIEAGIPVLVEKPLADTLEGAERLVRAAERHRVPLAVGHHRRHNPMIQHAKAMIDAGKLGRIVVVHAFFWLMKPDDYFDTSWRRALGAGPVLINLSHDIDLLRALCGEVVSVQAMDSAMVRNFEPEETCVVTLRFASGALGTVTISDTVVAPWSWEQTTGENPVYPETDQSCYFIAGTEGSLTIPKLELWRNPGTRSWWEPFEVERHYAPKADPLPLQIAQFVRVIRGEEAPLVPGREGLAGMKIIDAIKRAAATGETIGMAP